MIQERNKKLSKFFKIFATIWIYLFGIVVLLSIVGFFITASSFIAGWQKVTEVFSPFNVTNFIVTIILLSPALVAFKLHGHFEKKALKSNEEK